MEWRLYEDLKAADVSFHIEAGDILSADNREGVRHGRLITGDSVQIRYEGTSGFQVRWPNGREKYFRRSDDVVMVLRAHI
jgi:hypothetical protein